MITESILIKRDISTVYSAFANLNVWKQILPDVLDVRVLYDDGYHQEFLMTVERPNGAETIRGIRFCLPNYRLELFQPLPPPGFKRMTGVWTFEKCEDATRVTAERWFELTHLAVTSENASLPVSLQEVGDKLKHYLYKNLNLFKASLEIAP